MNYIYRACVCVCVWVGGGGSTVKRIDVIGP
jgi:hypothetical protein